MKIAHSIIVLTSVVFITGSMISVGMDLKTKTDNVYTNVTQARYKHDKHKEAYLDGTKKHEQKKKTLTITEGSLRLKETDQGKVLYKQKLESLNQNNTAGNKFLPGRKIENGMSVD